MSLLLAAGFDGVVMDDFPKRYATLIPVFALFYRFGE
jgi:hypothetical protein